MCVCLCLCLCLCLFLCCLLPLQVLVKTAQKDSRRWAAMGPILACGDTNAAVDNLVEGLVNKGLRVVRLGQPAKVCCVLPWVLGPQQILILLSTMHAVIEAMAAVAANSPLLTALGVPIQKQSQNLHAHVCQCAWSLSFVCLTVCWWCAGPRYPATIHTGGAG